MTDSDFDRTLEGMNGLNARRARESEELRSPSFPKCLHFSEGCGCPAGTRPAVAIGEAVRLLARGVVRQAGIVEEHADDPDADEVWTALHAIAVAGLMVQSSAAHMAQDIRDSQPNEDDDR